MKITLIAVSFLLLILSLVGIYQVYGLPPEKAVPEEVSLLDYEHQGEFDYIVALKPSHLYGPEPQATASTTPDLMKYPAEFIDRFELAFSYHFVPDGTITGTSEVVEIRATMRSTGTTAQQEITLMPETSKTGDFTVTFPLDIGYNATENYITISDNVSGSEITITAYVYTTVTTETGPVFESFTQSLPLRLKGPLIEMAGDLDYTSAGNIGDLNYEQYGNFNYEVYLKPDSPFGAIVLGPPSEVIPNTTPQIIAGPEDTIVFQLIDDMNISFSYHLESSQPLKTQDETVVIDAVLESPGKWSKTVTLVPLTNKSGDFTVTFPLDLEQLSELFSTIQRETGTSTSARSLTIRAKVHARADTDSGTIDADFIDSINTDLAADTLVWSDNLTQSEPGSIKTTVLVSQAEKYLWGTVSQVRIVLPIVASIVLVLFCFALLWYFRPRQDGLTVEEKEARQVLKKYKNMIIEIKQLPEVQPGEGIILLNSLDDLVKTAESLLKPVLHKVEGQRHVFCVFDAGTRYEYHLS
jgi:hypothetical protein